MKNYQADSIRNIAVLGHGGEGKTTLTEAMLFNAGLLDRMGKVDDGTTVSDYDPEETKRHISISVAVAPFEWNGTKVNLIDAPGFFDFYGEVYEAMALADSAIIVCSAGFRSRCRHRKSNEHVQKGKYAPHDRHQPDGSRKRKL